MRCTTSRPRSTTGCCTGSCRSSCCATGCTWSRACRSVAQRVRVARLPDRLSRLYVRARLIRELVSLPVRRSAAARLPAGRDSVFADRAGRSGARNGYSLARQSRRPSGAVTLRKDEGGACAPPAHRISRRSAAVARQEVHRIDDLAVLADFELERRAAARVGAHSATGWLAHRVAFVDEQLAVVSVGRDGPFSCFRITSGP